MPRELGDHRVHNLCSEQHGRMRTTENRLVIFTTELLLTLFLSNGQCALMIGVDRRIPFGEACGRNYCGQETTKASDGCSIASNSVRNDGGKSSSGGTGGATRRDRTSRTYSSMVRCSALCLPLQLLVKVFGNL